MSVCAAPWGIAAAKDDFIADLTQFAHAYAAIVEADHAMFQHRRLDVERAWRLE